MKSEYAKKYKKYLKKYIQHDPLAEITELVVTGTRCPREGEPFTLQRPIESLDMDEEQEEEIELPPEQQAEKKYVV